MHVKDCTLVKPLYCNKTAKAVEVAKLLRDNKQRRIIVVDGKLHPVGIISITDINNKVVAENKDAMELRAHEIMTSPIYLVCDIKDDLTDVFKKMLHHETFFCPVIKNNELYGILTYGEIIKHMESRNGNR